MSRSTQTKKLGDAIRALRNEAGMSQESLAEKTGLHRTYIGSVERGERNISLQNMIRIADALDTQASNLLAEADL